MNRDAIKPTIAEAIRFLFRKFPRLIMLGFLPGTVLVTLYFVIGSMFGGDGAGRTPSGSNAESILITGAELVLVPFYVAWHRLTLIGDAGVSGHVLPSMGRRDALYAGYTLLLALFSLPLEMLGEMVASSPETDDALPMIFGGLFLGVLLLVVLIWVFIRLSFLFVDTAVDGRATLREAWNMTRGGAYVLALIILPVFAIIFLICLGLVALVLIPVLSIADYGGSWMDAVYGVTNALALVVAGAYGVSATSIAYRDLTGWTPDQTVGT